MPSLRTSAIFVTGGSAFFGTNLVQSIAPLVGFRGKLIFYTSKPDGKPWKLLDSSRLKALGWERATPLRIGLQQARRDYQRDASRVFAEVGSYEAGLVQRS
jgi:GDP-L-fucose synthase